MARPPINGVECTDDFSNIKIMMTIYLELYRYGRKLDMPSNIGIYEDCSYWIHTHEEPGVIYVEAPIEKTFKLGDFFAIWGVDISLESFLGEPVTPDKPLKVYVDGKPFEGDPRDIVLKDGLKIAIYYG